MHLVESMAYTGQTPWHALGHQLAQRQPIEVWAKQAGMNWSIEEAPVRFVSDAANESSETLTFLEQKVLYRSDTKSPLSVVSNRYQVVQPREVLEFYRDLTEVGGFELETAGVLKGGRKLWALARTGQSVVLKGKDVVNGYLLLATACDGTLATTAQFTSVRVVCNNTLHIALADGTGAIKVPHRSVFDPQSVKRQLGIAISSWDTFMHQMKTLAERKVGHRQAQAYFETVLAVPGLGYGNRPSPNFQTASRAHKTVQALFEGHGRGADMPSSAGTAWGLLNAVTEYADHERRARNIDYRLDSAWFGPGATLKQKALDEALSLIA
jgi:phage/plasmid-like protein (TIGR03299 family)